MHPDPGSPTAHALAADRRVDAAWRQDRAFLLSFAQRTLGSRSDAEDVVQEAFGRLARVEVAAVDDLRGWLTVVVRRLCLDRLRSAYGRRVEAGLPPTDEPPPGERVGAAAGAVDPPTGSPSTPGCPRRSASCSTG